MGLAPLLIQRNATRRSQVARNRRRRFAMYWRCEWWIVMRKPTKGSLADFDGRCMLRCRRTRRLRLVCARQSVRCQRRQILRLRLEQLGQYLMLLLKQADGPQGLGVIGAFGRVRELARSQIMLLARGNGVGLVQLGGSVAGVRVGLEEDVSQRNSSNKRVPYQSQSRGFHNRSCSFRVQRRRPPRIRYSAETT